MYRKCGHTAYMPSRFGGLSLLLCCVVTVYACAAGSSTSPVQAEQKIHWGLSYDRSMEHKYIVAGGSRTVRRWARNYEARCKTRTGIGWATNQHTKKIKIRPTSFQFRARTEMTRHSGVVQTWNRKSGGNIGGPAHQLANPPQEVRMGLCTMSCRRPLSVLRRSVIALGFARKNVPRTKQAPLRTRTSKYEKSCTVGNAATIIPIQLTTSWRVIISTITIVTRITAQTKRPSD